MSNTIIYSASAGSGKTFSLVSEYISLLIANPRAYKNILAVTFTNKATLEMKERILEVLKGLAWESPNVQQYLNKISAKGFSHQAIKTNAFEALMNIIHDYSNFYVETIDTFFQRILRNLAREIGVSSYFNLLLDDKDYTKQAVKNLLDSVENNANPQLKNWLTLFINERIENGERWNLENTLVHFANQNLHKSVVKENINDPSLDVNRLLETAQKLLKETNIFIEKVNKYGREIKNICSNYGFDATDFKGQNRGIYSKFDRLIHFNRANNDSLFKEGAAEDISVWLKKDALNSDKESIIKAELMPLYGRINELFSEPYRLFFTQCCVLNRIYQTGLLKYIATEKAELLKEDSMFVLRDTPALLADMVTDPDDISFIYEKTGARFKHIMIDEFQDTSVLSWRNFRLLLQECLSNGNDVFIFGDVKQAIYRWNEGDWSMLNGLINNDKNFSFGLYPRTILLEDNWRTGRNIVDFNNALFKKTYQQKDPSIAQNLIQNPQKEDGLVRASFVQTPKGEDKTINMNEHLQREIDYYLDNGYQLDDMVILSRSNEKISIIADFLKDRTHNGVPYNPISDEAFAFSASQDVLIMVNAMKFIDDKRNTIALSWLLAQRNEDVDFWLQRDENGLFINDYLESLRQIKDKPLLEIAFSIAEKLNVNNDSSFVTAFYDKVLLYAEQKGSNLENFLSYWETDLQYQNISASQRKKSLQLTTIHKAKGLEYPVVIVPYCDWKLIKKGEMLWVENTKGIGDVKIFSASLKSLESTLYAEDAEKEAYAQEMDNTNLLYVALTRAKDCLSLLAEPPQNKDGYTNVADLLYDFFLSNYDSEEDREEGDEQFVIGNLPAQKPKSPTQETHTLPLKLGYNKVMMALSDNARQYFSAQSLSPSLARGNLLHRLMSLIITKEDKDKAINEVSVEYDLSAEKKAELNTTLEAMFAKTDSFLWFSGKYKTLIEQPLLTLDENNKPKTYRPDRVMIGEKEIIIVDYKFSLSQTHINEYREQISHYATLLSRMGYVNISAYLWLIGETNEQIILPELA
ncbi:MAG: UvrD-helicase domain-containing protein [Bacteroidales bacterium]|jgi:ATP-dependent exoDNAse (exonuclease V) beta subunit|nr:UvrD-helicase domain-containing protein [Bacteroidales bacterium]